jgi:signal transduction histidine kinase
MLLAAISSKKHREKTIESIIRHEVTHLSKSVEQNAKSYALLAEKSLERKNEIKKKLEQRLTIIRFSLVMIGKLLGLLKDTNFWKFVKKYKHPELYIISEGGEIDLDEQSVEIFLSNEVKTICERYNPESLFAESEPTAKNAETSGIDYYIKCDPEDTKVKLIRDGLDIIIRNLISNAVDYCLPDTRVKVEVAATEMDVLVTFTNSGKALKDPADRYRMMESGWRGDHDKPGSGKGLHLARVVGEGMVEGPLGVFIEPDPKPDPNNPDIYIYKFTVRAPRLR